MNRLFSFERSHTPTIDSLNSEVGTNSEEENEEEKNNELNEILNQLTTDRMSVSFRKLARADSNSKNVSFKQGTGVDTPVDKRSIFQKSK